LVARFTLDPNTEPPEQALAALAAGDRRLDALLLGAARDQLGDGQVIVVPPGRLNAVPWALLPSLAGRAVSVAPSARTWLRASNTRSFGINKTVLVSGPGLGAASAEVRTLAEQYGDATVLGDGTATTARVLQAIDGAGLAHIAAHGVFRAAGPAPGALAAALRDARADVCLADASATAADDPVVTAAGWSFIALGA
jgi:CHAT domain-containing protein